MRVDRRQFLAGAALAATASTGCLQGEADAANGGTEPTTAIAEDPRVDDPPYEIEEQPADREAWNRLYLCEHMPAASDLAFQTVPAPRLTDPLLTDVEHGGEEHAVRTLTSATEVREVFAVGDGTGNERPERTGDGGGMRDGGGTDDAGEPEEPIDAIDFDGNVLLVVESGYGSGSITHHWKRAEATERGLRLHGCHAVPYERTDDLTSRHSVVRVERPDDFEFARVSVTVGAARRVHVNSTEGVVEVASDG